MRDRTSDFPYHEEYECFYYRYPVLEDGADSALRLNVATTTEHLRNDLGKIYGLVLY